MKESETNDLELRHFDQSSENMNDNTSSVSLEAVFTQKEVDAAQVSGQMEQLLQSSDTLEPEKARKIGKCNLRKSLAWDSAFFTNAGFLEPDELSSMIKGADKRGKHFLPGIEEDMHRSFDSISTLESESLTLESLEADFFEDIRASIQKSSKASNRTSSSSTKAAPGEIDTQSICPLKKVDAPKNLMKLKPALKKQTIAMHGPGKLTKQSSGSQGTQPVASNGGGTSSVPKPPRVIGRPNPMLSEPLKRASLDANKVKRENDKAKGSSVPCKVGLVSNLSGLGGPFKTVPKPAPSSKFYSLSPVVGGKGISPVTSGRRRIDSKMVNPASSNSTLQNPSKVPLKNKGQTQLTLSKQTSNASPASSFSDWSSVSSSSTSTVNQRSSSSRVSIDTTSPCRSLDSDAPPALENHSQSNDQISMCEHKVNPQPSENQERASMQGGVLSRPATVQPTGLRMPSPKLGFFDGMKPVDRTPKGSMQSCSGIPPRPKIGARISNPNGVSCQANNRKLQPTTTGNLKLDSKKPASAVPSQKPSNASPKVSNVSGSVNKNRNISTKSQNKIDGDSCLRATKIVCEEPDGKKSKSPGVLKSEVNLEKQVNTKLKESNVAPAEGDTYVSINLGTENINLTEDDGEHANFILQQLGNEFNSLWKEDEKENAPFEDHVEGLSLHVEAISAKSQNKIDGESCLRATKIVCEGPDGKKSRSPGVLKSEVNLEKQDNTKLKESNVAPAEGDTYVSVYLGAEKIKLTEDDGEHANFILQQLENELNSLWKGDEKEDAPFEDHVEGLSLHVEAISAKSQNKIDGESCLRATKIVCDGPDGKKSRSPGVLKSEVNLEKQDNTKLKESNVAPAEGDTYVSVYLGAEKIKLTEDDGEHANFILQQLENELNSLWKGDEKENAPFEDHVEGLSLHVEAIVSKQELQKEPVGNSISQFDSSHLDSDWSCLKEFSCLGEKGGSPSNLLAPTLIALSPVTSEINASARTPLAVKNSYTEDDREDNICPFFRECLDGKLLK